MMHFFLFALIACIYCVSVDILRQRKSFDVVDIGDCLTSILGQEKSLGSAMIQFDSLTIDIAVGFLFTLVVYLLPSLSYAQPFYAAFDLPYCYENGVGLSLNCCNFPPANKTLTPYHVVHAVFANAPEYSVDSHNVCRLTLNI